MAISLSPKEKQELEYLKRGFPPIHLNRPAQIGDGIIQFDELNINYYADLFEEVAGDLALVKFVPASGAATRMFKHLYAYTEHAEDILIKELQDGIQHLACYPALEKTIIKLHNRTLQELVDSGDWQLIFNAILGEDGLGYGALPKGLIDFHNYGSFQRKAVAEHLFEGASYARESSGDVHLHFTVSPEHEERFKAYIDTIRSRYEEEHGVTYHISYSYQSAETDTIAADGSGNVITNNDGSLYKRPGGHGALIKNLAQIEADLIFVKNIDNVVPAGKAQPTTLFKQVLAAFLNELKERRDAFLVALRNDETSEELLQTIGDFARDELYLDIEEDASQADLLMALDRPMRVCGMVENQGEPGGGPFWVTQPEGKVSLQIVEKAQINANDPEQLEILAQATHFNPVDLVCATRDERGEVYSLNEFTDPNTGFVTEKSVGGTKIKALELPGLWNGAMANWITLFVEVPIQTFNPVKTINDLLRPMHQA